MTSIPSQLSVAEAATIINAIITFIQITLSLALIIVLIYFLPKTNSTASWSCISRMLHSSVWPAILRTESSSNQGAGTVVSIISYLSLMSTILVPIAGVALPLGLREGPLLHSSHQDMEAKYIPDPSALGLATSPNRQRFQYGRLCGIDVTWACQSVMSNESFTAYQSPVTKVFSSTPHGPFSMQYRRFSDGRDGRKQLSAGIFGTFQSLIPRENIFVVEGLIVDMSLDHFGVGFWNQTVPAAAEGGTWTQDVLWLEPDTECVDTNLTVDYVADFPIQQYNLTDHGGFSNLPEDRFIVTSNDQNISLRQHAYKGAVDSNFYALRSLNLTVGTSTHPTSKYFKTHFSDGPANTRVANLPLNYSSTPDLAIADLDVLCQGYEGTEIAGIQKVQVTCGVLLGPPQRTDGGDQRVFDRGSQWSQPLHVCASATRASIQTIAFSMNDTSNFQSLHVTRLSTNHSVLWGVEIMDQKIQNINLLWGRVADEFENNASHSTLRSDHLYLPAGASGARGSIDFGPDSPAIDTLFPGEPLSAHATAWVNVYGAKPNPALTDYTGGFDYSIRTKFQTIFELNPRLGPAQIRNIVWTDIMANSLVGTQASPTLLVARNRRSISYDFRFAIPGFILVVIWAPIFVIAVALLVTRMLTFSYMRQILDHTSVGKVVVGGSALQVVVKLDVAAELNRTAAGNHVRFLDRVQETGGNSPGLHGDNDSTLVLLDLSQNKGHLE